MIRIPYRIGTLILSVVLTAPTFGQEQENGTPSGDDHKAMDAQVNRAVLSTIGQGVELYNAGDQAGCYRLFQGALTSLSPILEYRPELQEKAQSGLQEAASQPDLGWAAQSLRSTLNEIYTSTKSNSTLWERLGGTEVIEPVVHDFVILAAGDSDINLFRDERYPLDNEGVERLERLMVEFLSSITNGPLEYSGGDLKSVHQGMKVSESEFKALAADFVAVLKKHEVPEKEINELIALLGTYKDDIVEQPESDS